MYMQSSETCEPCSSTFGEQSLQKLRGEWLSVMKYGLALLACITTTQVQTTAFAQVSGDWSVAAAQGYQEHIVTNGPGNSFNISCDIGAASAGELKKRSIFVEIIGKSPKPHSFVDVFAIDRVFRFVADDRGTINTDCRACEGDFAGLWSRLRKASAIVVQYPDGTNSSFKTAGGAKAFSPKPCEAGIAR